MFRNAIDDRFIYLTSQLSGIRDLFNSCLLGITIQDTLICPLTRQGLQYHRNMTQYKEEEMKQNVNN